MRIRKDMFLLALLFLLCLSVANGCSPQASSTTSLPPTTSPIPITATLNATETPTPKPSPTPVLNPIGCTKKLLEKGAYLLR